MNRLIYLLLSAMIVCLLPQILIAQTSAQTIKQEQEDKRCKSEKLDLTGTYTGVLFIDKNQKEGTPATLAVSANKFELTSDTLHGSGLISGVKSCGDIGIALKFTRSNDENVTRTSISMDARVAGGEGQLIGDLNKISSVKPVIMATTEDEEGNLAGPDIAFVICPKYPDCKRYKTCTCPEPPRNKP